MKQVSKPQSTSPPKSRSNGDNRRHEERRKKYGKGYIYLSMVGWYCRRERNRRKNDSFT